MDSLEFSKVGKEDSGHLTTGRLKLTNTQILFKSNKTGKLEPIMSSEIQKITWQRMADDYAIRLMLQNGNLVRYGGLKESDKDKIEKFVDSNYSLPLETQNFSIRGWNWGNATFEGSVLNFDIKNSEKAFEIPLSNVNHTTTAKNEVTLEFQQNDEAPVSLMEMRFHIPTIDGMDPVQNFMESILKKANIIPESGECIAVFKELQCLTPRGRYDIKIFPTYIQLHGKTFDYKIPITSVLRLFQLPHKDSRQVFFVMSLDPPIKQGQTRYHFLILLFNKDEDSSIELGIDDADLKGKYEGKLQRIMSGPLFEIVAKIMRVLIQRKISMPDSSFASKDLPAVTCSYRASNGLMYPLERGFIYLHKPPVHIRFDEISSINFARSGGSTRSFDFEIETKSGIVHTFSSIDKEEYSKLFDFVSNKGLRVKNVGTETVDKKKKPVVDDLIDSDLDDDEPDAYLQRVREEGRIRTEAGDSDESDEDFNPGQDEDEVAEEFDSNVSSSDDDSEAGSDSDAERKKKKKHKPKKSKDDSGKEKKPRKSKKNKDKDENKPKRPQSAYFLWMNEKREEIKKEYPGLSVTEFAKKAGDLWKELKERTKWEELAAKAKKTYEKEMAEYKANGGGASTSGEKKKPKKSNSDSKKAAPKGSPVKTGGFKSKEYLSSSSDSSSDEPEEEKPAKKKSKKEAPSSKPSKPTKKAKKEASSESDVKMDSESEEILSSPTASSASDSD